MSCRSAGKMAGLVAAAGLLLCVLVEVHGLRVDAAEIPPAVQALLKAQCVKCHGPNKPKAGLDLSAPSSLSRGGESGVVVVGGKLDRSLL